MATVSAWKTGIASTNLSPKTIFIIGLAKRAETNIKPETSAIRPNSFFIYEITFCLLSNPENRGLTTAPKLETSKEKSRVMRLAAAKIPAWKLLESKLRRITSIREIKTEKTRVTAIHLAKWNSLVKVSRWNERLIFTKSLPKVMRIAKMVEITFARRAVSMERRLKFRRIRTNNIFIPASMIWVNE